MLRELQKRDPRLVQRLVIEANPYDLGECLAKLFNLGFRGPFLMLERKDDRLYPAEDKTISIIVQSRCNA